MTPKELQKLREAELDMIENRNRYLFARWIEGDTFAQLSAQSYPKVSGVRVRQIITRILQDKGIAPIPLRYGEGALRGILTDYLWKLPNKCAQRLRG